MPGSSLVVMLACELRRVAADEIGPLVHIHADAVAEAVGEVFVVRSVAGVGDDFARGGVDRSALDPGRAAASAADCARCTMSNTFFILS